MWGGGTNRQWRSATNELIRQTLFHPSPQENCSNSKKPNGDGGVGHLQRRYGLKTLGAESCNFSTLICKFPSAKLPFRYQERSFWILWLHVQKNNLKFRPTHTVQLSAKKTSDCKMHFHSTLLCSVQSVPRNLGVKIAFLSMFFWKKIVRQNEHFPPGLKFRWGTAHLAQLPLLWCHQTWHRRTRES